MNKKTLLVICVLVALGIVYFWFFLKPLPQDRFPIDSKMNSIPSDQVTEQVFCGSTPQPVYCARYRCVKGFSTDPGVPGSGLKRCTDGSVPIFIGKVPEMETR